jgi:lipopolysaccharide/colanic/teichoic acid biosynthesis glycosyltransferase
MTSPKMQRRPSQAHADSLAESFGSEILDERSFTAMLCLERKRTERSGRRFVLMLLESRGLVRRRDGGETALDSVMRTLLNSTRETDIKGWYKDQSIVGVIFTEIGTGDGRVVANALLTRVTSALSSTLTIDDIKQIHISFHVFPDDLAEQGIQGPPDLTLYPDQGTGNTEKKGSRLMKRVLDISGSLFALVLFSPVLLAIAVAITLTSRGPVLFRQQRVGRYGTRFTFLKFRSMYVANDESIHRDYVRRLITHNAAADQSAESRQPAFKIRNDPRVTPIGRILRRTSLDELPQLFNVLHGEMSLVGPRPPIPYEYACYNTWHRRRLLTVKPGITGLWQVRGRSRVSFDEMVRLDLKYAETWSVWLDLKILCLTPAAVVSGEGAY